MGHSVTHMEETILCVTLRRIYESNGTHLDLPRTDLFVQCKKVGVFLVKMRGSFRVLHSICVDTREHSGWVYYSSKPYAMGLTAEALHLCVGDNLL